MGCLKTLLTRTHLKHHRDNINGTVESITGTVEDLVQKGMLAVYNALDEQGKRDLNFLQQKRALSPREPRILIVSIKPKDFGTLISGSPGEDPKLVANFRDLMEKMYVLDPDESFTVSHALSHPFILMDGGAGGCSLQEKLAHLSKNGDPDDRGLSIC